MDKALFKLSYGMYVVSSFSEEKINGQIADAVFQVTAEPPKVAAAINKENLTHEMIENSGIFSVSVLEKQTPLDLVRVFGFSSGRNKNKFEKFDYKVMENGVPILLQNSLAYLVLKISEKLDAGTHTIFVGDVIESNILKEGESMTYDYYRKIKEGATPKPAPTFQSP